MRCREKMMPILLDFWLTHIVTHTANKLYPVKWTQKFDPRPRLVDTHLTHRVKWPHLWYDEVNGWRYSMGTREKFTPEKLKHLRANPYTQRATPDSISYILAFKEAFWTLSLQGCTGMASFRKPGYNTEVLGLERIHNTTKRIRQATKSPEALCECTRGGVRLTGGTGLAVPEQCPDGEGAVPAGRRLPLWVLQLDEFPEGQRAPGGTGPGGVRADSGGVSVPGLCQGRPWEPYAAPAHGNPYEREKDPTAHAEI